MGESRRAEAQMSTSQRIEDPSLARLREAHEPLLAAPVDADRKIALVKLRDAVHVAGKESRSLIAGERGAPRDATQPAGQCILHRVLGGIQVETLDGKDCLYVPDGNIVMVKYAPRAPSAA